MTHSPTTAKPSGWRPSPPLTVLTEDVPTWNEASMTRRSPTSTRPSGSTRPNGWYYERRGQAYRAKGDYGRSEDDLAHRPGPSWHGHRAGSPAAEPVRIGSVAEEHGASKATPAAPSPRAGRGLVAEGRPRRDEGLADRRRAGDGRRIERAAFARMSAPRRPDVEYHRSASEDRGTRAPDWWNPGVIGSATLAGVTPGTDVAVGRRAKKGRDGVAPRGDPSHGHFLIAAPMIRRKAKIPIAVLRRAASLVGRHPDPAVAPRQATSPIPSVAGSRRSRPRPGPARPAAPGRRRPPTGTGAGRDRPRRRPGPGPRATVGWLSGRPPLIGGCSGRPPGPCRRASPRPRGRRTPRAARGWRSRRPPRSARRRRRSRRRPR